MNCDQCGRPCTRVDSLGIWWRCYKGCAGRYVQATPEVAAANNNHHRHSAEQLAEFMRTGRLP